MNQIEGSIIMGMGGALSEAIEFENGVIKNPRVSDCRVLRVSHIPPHRNGSAESPGPTISRWGEPPMVAIAPSIGNAIFDATGVRHRSLPMRPNEGKT